MIETSVIIPIKNEEENIITLIDELERVMEGLGRPWELICIDDGSTDQSLAILEKLCKEKPYIRVLAFAKNYGQTSAFAAGFANALGEFIITLDGDGQNDPADIPKLTAAIADADMVIGWRVNRKDSWQKRIISKIANTIRSRLCHDEMHDTGCSLKIYRKEALNKIKLFDGMHRFLPALFKIENLHIKEIPVNHRERTKGVTKYHFFNRSLKPFIDLFVVRWMGKHSLHYEVKEQITHETWKK